ncbi:MAG: serine/threonine-protein kinase [Planctomycetota bacterium]
MALSERDDKLVRYLQEEGWLDPVRMRLILSMVDRGEAPDVPQALKRSEYVDDTLLSQLLSRVGAMPTAATEKPELSEKDEEEEDAVLADRPRIDQLAGIEVGDYKVVELLGKGAMGVVYKGLATEGDSAGQPFAMKFLKPRFLQDPRFLIRFLREARTMEGLRHPGLVAAHGHGQWRDLPFLVMDFVEGNSLADLLRVNKRLFEWRVLWLASKILAPLQVLHDAHIVHRDLKPPNILIDNGYGPRVTDFGVVADLKSASGRLTKVGSVVGTGAFIAPELAGVSHEKNAVDGRADLYSLGCVLYCCLVGKPPFAGKKGLDLFLAHKHEAPPPISVHVPVDPRVEAYVMKMLEKAPADRPQSAEEARQEANRLMQAVQQPPNR